MTMLRRHLRLLPSVTLVFMAGYLCVAQPGMCPYWMIGDVSILSGAPANAEHARHHPQHNHNQNRDFFLATTAPAMPQVILTAAALLALLAGAARLESVFERRLIASDWQPSPLSPPPRFISAT